MYYYVDDSKKPSTECQLDGSFASLDNDEYCFYNGTQFEIDAYIYDPTYGIESSTRKYYYLIRGYANIVDNAQCNYIYHQDRINITFYFSRSNTSFNPDYSNTDYSTALAYCFGNKLYYNFTYSFRHYEGDSIDHHYALIRLSPYKNEPRWNFTSSLTFQEIVIATYCPHESINLLNWYDSNIGDKHKASCPTFTRFYGDLDDLTRTCEKNGFYSYFNRSRTGCEDLNRTFIFDVNVTAYINEDGYSVVNGKIKITQIVKEDYEFIPAYLYLYLGFRYSIENIYYNHDDIHKTVSIPYDMSFESFEFELVNFTSREPEYMNKFFAEFYTTREYQYYNLCIYI